MRKGEFNGECNRTACSNKNAVYYNKGTHAYYCDSCAMKINELCSENICYTRQGKQLDYLKDLESKQLAFMKSCGETLEGYRKNYGDIDFPRENGKPMSGNGGTAIYNADVKELEQIQRKIKAIESLELLEKESI